MKRKAEVVEEQPQEESSSAKNVKRQKSVSKKPTQHQTGFRKDLFEEDVLTKYSENYAKSTPYKHGVIRDLIDDALLRNVRCEIEDIGFARKETDIYKIRQSGDLANLSGLPDAELAKLPSLLELRNALYSPAFRKYVATITSSGALSGQKTDMAINEYKPGCHLLCHDDVIGSRRVSYILYLTNPDIPWQDEWGGALRLYPTTTIVDDKGEETKIPSPDFSKVIPPAWNQLSFFAVQPGESFHDVEEVYHAETEERLEKEGGRIRMAISGWFHIPQKGEEGYVEGAEELLAANSSLAQLQGNPDQYDFPRNSSTLVSDSEKLTQQDDFSQSDLDFLLKYMEPTYLKPETREQIRNVFTDESSINLTKLLNESFSTKLKSYILDQESNPLPTHTTEIVASTPWRVARPPHKHRFLYIHPTQTPSSSFSSQFSGDDSAIDVSSQSKPISPTTSISQTESPFRELINVFLPSRQFRHWLALVTDCEIEEWSVLARRFRKGKDYTLATSHEGEARLEWCLGITPSEGWGGGGAEEGEGEDGLLEVVEEEDSEVANAEEEEKVLSKGKGKGKAAEQSAEATPDSEAETELAATEHDEDEEEEEAADDEIEIIEDPEEGEGEVGEEQEKYPHGGYEMYMAADEPNPSSGTTDDAAVYRQSAPSSSSHPPPPNPDPNTNTEGDTYHDSHHETDNSLFDAPASWNTLSIVLRDSGTLKFVKYVSASARGDRWDVVGEFGVVVREGGSDEEEDVAGGEGERSGKEVGQERERVGDEEVGAKGVVAWESSEDEGFKGFPESSDSDSD